MTVIDDCNSVKAHFTDYIESIWDFEIRNANLIFFEKNLKKPCCRAQKVRK